MNKILRSIVEQTGVKVDALYPYEPDVDEYLLTYDKSKRICITFGKQKDDAYYSSASWSCDALGYIVLSEGYAYLYGALLKKPEKYKEDLVLDNFEAFIKYLGRYTLKPHQNVYSYLFDVIGRLHQIARPIVGADRDNYPIIYAALWGAEVANMPDALKAIIDGFLEGINLNGNKIVPVQQLLARYIAPSMVDVLSLLYTKAQMVGKAIEDIGSLGLGLINSIRVAPYIFNDIINNNLRFDKSKAVFKIFAPFITSSTPIVETIIALRSKGYTGKIEVEAIQLHAGLSSPLYFDQIVKLNQDKDVSLNLRKEFSLNCKWPSDCDLIIAMPNYPILESLLDQLGADDKYYQAIGFSCIEDIPYLLMNKATTSLTKDGTMILLSPTYFLKDESSCDRRLSLSESFSIHEVRHLSSYALARAGSLTSVICGLKKEGQAERVNIRWCDDTPDGYDIAMRLVNKNKVGVPADNTDLKPYSISAEMFAPINWSPRPYSENLVLMEIYDNDTEKSFVPASELFTISSGIRTGNNDVYVHDYSFMHEISDEEKRFFKPVVVGHSLKDGQIVGDKIVFFPYNANGLIVEGDSSFKRLLPNYSQYLIRNKAWISQRASKELKIWELVYCKKLHVPGRRKIVSSYYGNLGSFACDLEGNYVVSSGYQWLPCGRLDNDEYLLAYLAILSSNFFWKVAEGFAEHTYNTNSSDRYKLSKSSIGSIPLPDLSKPRFRGYLNELVEIGYSIMKEGCRYYTQIPDLDALVTNIYKK